MSLYQDYLIGMRLYQEQLLTAYHNLKNWHLAKQFDNKIKNTELPKAEVKNRQELYQAKKARRFYRLAY